MEFILNGRAMSTDAERRAYDEGLKAHPYEPRMLDPGCAFCGKDEVHPCHRWEFAERGEPEIQERKGVRA